MKRLIISTIAAFGLSVMPALAERAAAPEGAKVYFLNLEDGATADSPVKVVFGLSGMGVAPAGTDKENTGHHHVLLDRAPFGDGPDDAAILENGLPADDHHIHFGGGQTEVSLDLAPGSHTLQLILGDQFHIPHEPPLVSEVITITVE